MEVTFAKHTDGKIECLYREVHFAVSDKHIAYYSLREISQAELEEIKNVTTDKVQELLSKYI